MMKKSDIMKRKILISSDNHEADEVTERINRRILIPIDGNETEKSFADELKELQTQCDELEEPALQVVARGCPEDTRCAARQDHPAPCAGIPAPRGPAATRTEGASSSRARS